VCSRGSPIVPAGGPCYIQNDRFQGVCELFILSTVDFVSHRRSAKLYFRVMRVEQTACVFDRGWLALLQPSSSCSSRLSLADITMQVFWS